MFTCMIFKTKLPQVGDLESFFKLNYFSQYKLPDQWDYPWNNKILKQTFSDFDKKNTQYSQFLQSSLSVCLH